MYVCLNRHSAGVPGLVAEDWLENPSPVFVVLNRGFVLGELTDE